MFPPATTPSTIQQTDDTIQQTDDKVQQTNDTVQETDKMKTKEEPNAFSYFVGGAITALYAVVTFKWLTGGAESPATEKEASARGEPTSPTTP